jgi:SlyX protein
MEERVVELETRLAFQEDAIHHLNQTVAEQQRHIDALLETVEQLKQRLQSLSPSPLEGDQPEPPPPHY